MRLTRRILCKEVCKLNTCIIHRYHASKQFVQALYMVASAVLSIELQTI